MKQSFSIIIPIIIFLTSGITPSLINAQDVSSASMKVSARVIQPAEVVSNLPDQIDLNNTSPMNSGKLKLGGFGQMKPVLVIPQNVILKNDEGDRLEVDILISDLLSSNERKVDYRVRNSSKKKARSGNYQGEMKATVVYL